MTYVVKIHQFDYDTRCGRHVVHDERNRMYAVQPDLGTPYRMDPVRHHSNLPVLNQGNVGACTGYATAGLIGYDQFWTVLTDALRATFSAKDIGLQIYSKATSLDSIPGSYPPADTGSDGPDAAKAATLFGYFNGYRHAFSLTALNTALRKTPVMVGTTWYNSMFQPDPRGHVTVDPSSGVAGGHEYVCDEYDPGLDRYGFLNSWGASFGVNGRFYIPRTSFTSLLADQGDVTVPVPLSAPAPVPVPVPAPPKLDADVLDAYKSLKSWAVKNGAI